MEGISLLLYLMDNYIIQNYCGIILHCRSFVIYSIYKRSTDEMNSAAQFLKKHGLAPEGISPVACSEKMLENMKAGLNGHAVDMPMIPTYLKGTGTIPLGRNAVVIDAGGTNYRSALACFTEDGCQVSGLKVCHMPGTDHPVSWEEFISFVADSFMPFAAEADVIGFCFSYNADITPEMDGIVQRIDKEVVITGCEGKRIGASLIKELESRGVYGKKVVILNDTVAALLGGSAELDKTKYSDYIGMICGTGVNTCAPVAVSKITKLSSSNHDSMLINLESGNYSGMPCGDVDRQVDAESNVPGEKLMEKMCSGAYIGEVCHTALKKAVEEGLLPAYVAERMDKIEVFNGAVVDSWACGKDPYGVFDTKEELEFARETALAIFERSARCMAANVFTLMRLNDSGKTADHPACVCAEGSLISRSRYFLPFLKESLEKAAEEGGRYAEIVLGHDTTLPGSAVAALLNT